jgi:hypothetical protein
MIILHFEIANYTNQQFNWLSEHGMYFNVLTAPQGKNKVLFILFYFFILNYSFNIFILF